MAGALKGLVRRPTGTLSMPSIAEPDSETERQAESKTVTTEAAAVNPASSPSGTMNRAPATGPDSHTSHDDAGSCFDTQDQVITLEAGAGPGPTGSITNGSMQQSPELNAANAHNNCIDALEFPDIPVDEKADERTPDRRSDQTDRISETDNLAGAALASENKQCQGANPNRAAIETVRHPLAAGLGPNLHPLAGGRRPEIPSGAEIEMESPMERYLKLDCTLYTISDFENSNWRDSERNH